MKFLRSNYASQVGGISRRSVLAGAAGLAGLPLLSGLSFGQENINMRVSWWGSDDRHQKTLAVLKLFEEMNPGLSMASQYGGFLGYQDKLSTEFAGGNGPDVMQVASSAPLIEAGRLLELDPYIESGAIDLSDANKAVLETSKYKGKLYSIPWGLACGCFFLDTKVFADVGIELPGMDWTWDWYADAAKKIAAGTPEGVYGSADIWAPAGTRSLAALEVFLRQREMYAFTADGQLGFGPDELTEWFTFWDELRLAGAVPPAEVTALEGGFETSPIVTGRTAMYPINSSIASSLQALAPNELVIRTFPNGIGSEALSGPKFGQFINSSMMIYVNADSAHVDKAIEFVNFVTNNPDAAKIHLMARGVPLSSKMAALTLPDISPIEQSMVEVIQYVQEESHAGFIPWPTKGGEIQELMQRSHQELAFGQSNVADTVTRFFDEADFIIS